jgi:hypothetical protein
MRGLTVNPFATPAIIAGHEGDVFALTGDVAESLLSITAVHPMRLEAVDDLLARVGTDESVVRNLVAQGQLVEMGYEGQTFYMRKLSREV